MRHLKLALALLFCISVYGSAEGATLVPDADAYVQRTTSDDNFGQADHLRLKNEGGNNRRKSYIRFDTSSLTTMVESASLKLNFFDTDLGGGGTTTNWEFEVYGLNDGDPGENWVQATGQTSVVGATPPNPIVWDNAPANNTGSGNGFLGNATSLGTFDILGRTDNVDFTSSALIDFLNDDTNGTATFLLARNTPQPNGANSYVHGIASTENTTIAGPSLDVTVAAVPEPASFAIWSLIGLGLTGFGYYRTRRKK